MHCFIAVNYGTSSIIKDWVLSIRKFAFPKMIILVDNFKNNEERVKVKAITKELDIELIEAENIGYGNALNLGIIFCKKYFKEKEFIVLAGNLDIEYTNITTNTEKGRYVFVPKIIEGDRNRNPFLTHIQKRFLNIHTLAAKMNSILVLNIGILLIKLSGILNSKIWTIHGALFCFHSDCLDGADIEIFNSNTFLYCEELEFGSFMESINAEFIESGIQIRHTAHVATGSINTSQRKYLSLWKPSFMNWKNRDKYLNK